jgi:hypothetical protein
MLVVELRIIQLAHESGVWINDAYEVVTVNEHRPGVQQQPSLLD